MGNVETILALFSIFFAITFILLVFWVIFKKNSDRGKGKEKKKDRSRIREDVIF